MKEEAKKSKQKALAFAGVILGAIFTLTLLGNLDTAQARGGFRHFADAGEKWHKLYQKKHKKHKETISVECGDTIGPGGYFRLDADLDCSDPATASAFDAALMVIGPVTLDLRGHSIIGNSNLDGILVDGEKANIRHGTVKGFYNAVVVDGDGHHKIFKIKAAENEEKGFVVNSDHNRLTFNTASDNGDNGYFFIGSYNWLVKNRAEKNGDEGFYGSSVSEQNKIYLNRAIGNVNEGFQIVGPENRISHNRSKDNQNDGITIDGNRNFVYKNRILNNAERGLEVDGRENKLIKNRIEQNQGNGIYLEKFNAGDDFEQRNEDNILMRNRVKENLEFDIFNENLSCEHSIWKKNKFDTSNLDCIQ